MGILGYPITGSNLIAMKGTIQGSSFTMTELGYCIAVWAFIDSSSVADSETRIYLGNDLLLNGAPQGNLGIENGWTSYGFQWFSAPGPLPVLAPGIYKLLISSTAGIGSLNGAYDTVDGFIRHNRSITGAPDNWPNPLTGMTDTPDQVLSIYALYYPATGYPGASMRIATTNPWTILSAPSRVTFYAKGRWWVFYRAYDYGTNSDGIYFSSSLNGVLWDNNTYIANIANSLCSIVACTDGSYVHMVYGGNGGTAITYRRGLLNSDGSIAFDAAQEVASASATITAITLDTEGYPWISYFNSSTTQEVVTRSSTKDGTWNTASGFPKDLLLSSRIPTVVALTGNKTYTVAGITNNIMQGALYDGANFDSTEDITASNLVDSVGYGVVADGDNVHVVFLKAVTNDVVHVKRTFGEGWGAETVIIEGVSATSYPIISKYNDGLICLWANNNVIYYSLYTNGEWSAAATLLDVSINTLTLNVISASEIQQNGTIAVLRTEPISAAGVEPNGVTGDMLGMTLATILLTHAATVVNTRASLHGELVLGSSETIVYFEYGDTIGLGNVTDSQSISAGEVFSALLSPLKPNTTYYFRAVATNDSGNHYGDILNFTTGEMTGANILVSKLVFNSVN